MMKIIHSKLLLASLLLMGTFANAQIMERLRPEAWNNLVYGGRFMDRFLPIPPQGKLTSDTWGGDNVIPRYVENGIEDREWSYWGGNAVLGDDGKYHRFVCRWREDSPKGHGEWSHSIVVHAVSDSPLGPYKVIGIVGPGHNPEIYRMKDGHYVLYVIDGRYVADNLNGPWEFGHFKFDPRGRPIIEGLSNLSFAQREDGSFIMVDRGGGIWFSKDGLAPYAQITDKRVYPPVDGRFEDPVIWRTDIQYHLIVNDWYGRIAYYLRSKDGVHWKVDPGEAYLPGITKYTDGTEEDWFKYERIKMLQDSLGRAFQANFAVIDTLKKEDRPQDRHSSKNIGIPLAVGKQIQLLGKGKITSSTRSISIKIKAETRFDPHKDIDVNSLRFGSPEEVNFGRGCKVNKTKQDGADLIVTFIGAGNGFTDADFTGKLLGRTSDGKLLFGYARLPWVNYNEPILSALLPKINKDGTMGVEVENFGQVASESAKIDLELKEGAAWRPIASGTIPKLEPFQKTEIDLSMKIKIDTSREQEIKVVIYSDGQEPSVLTGILLNSQ